MVPNRPPDCLWQSRGGPGGGPQMFPPEFWLVKLVLVVTRIAHSRDTSPLSGLRIAAVTTKIAAEGVWTRRIPAPVSAGS